MSGHPLTRFEILLFAVLISPVFAEQPIAQSQQTTAARSTTRIMSLDVIVTDKNGKAVRNLSKDDFTIFEDGKAQSIASFTPSRNQEDKTRQQNESTVTGHTALAILVLDDLGTQIADQFFARSEIRKFLHAHGPVLSQPTALMTLGQKGFVVLHDYTRNETELEDALQRHPAELPLGLMIGQGGVGSSERLTVALDALREIAAANANVSGRKNVVWIGSGFHSLSYLNLGPRERDNLLAWVKETSNLMWEGRVAMYTLDPRGSGLVNENGGYQLINRGFLAPPDPTAGELVFEAIAPQSGGRTHRGPNDLDSIIGASIEDGGSYYTLSYYPSNSTWDGTFRTIRVTTRVSGLDARTRIGYFGFAEVPANQHLDTVLSRAISNPVPYHALEIQAKVPTLGSGTRTARFVIEVEPTHLTWFLLPNGIHRCEVTLVAASFSKKGKLISKTVKQVEGIVEAGRFAEQSRTPMTFAFTAELPSTTVRVRLVARDAGNGNIGTTDFTPK
jgi:VWFA-related protein